MRRYELMVILDPEHRGAHRRAVTRPVPQGRQDRRWQRREGRHLGPPAPGVRDREEVRRHLRGHRPDGRAGHGQGARPAAEPERDRSCARRSCDPRPTERPRPQPISIRRAAWQATPDHDRRQSRQRPGAPLHPERSGGRDVPRGVDSALPATSRRTSGRTARASSSPATSGGRRRRTAPSRFQQGMRVIVAGPAQAAVV